MEYSTGVFIFLIFFSLFPKLSQTFLYLEVEKATDQKFGSKSRLKPLKIERACQSDGVLPDRIPDKPKDNRSEDEQKQRFALKHCCGDGFLSKAAN